MQCLICFNCEAINPRENITCWKCGKMGFKVVKDETESGVAAAKEAGLKKNSVMTASKDEGIALIASKKKDLQWALRIMYTIEPTKPSKRLDKLIDDINNTPHGRKQMKQFFKSLGIPSKK
jgi:ribosomal protein L40E